MNGIDPSLQFIDRLYRRIKTEVLHKRYLTQLGISLTRVNVIFQEREICYQFVTEMKGPLLIPDRTNRQFSQYREIEYERDIITAWQNRSNFQVVLLEEQHDTLYRV